MISIFIRISRDFAFAVIFLFFLTVTPSYCQNIGLEIGHSFNTWDNYGSCNKIDVFAEFTMCQRNISLIPQLGFMVFYSNIQTNTSTVSTSEVGFGFRQEESLDILYNFLKFGRYIIGIGPRFSFLIFQEQDDLFTGAMILPAEVRFSTGGAIRTRCLITQHFGVNANLSYEYVPQSTLNVNQELYSDFRPFDSYSTFQLQLGIYYNFHFLNM